MTYLLDTNACIEYLNRRDSAVARTLATVHREEVVLCDIVKAELYYGAYRSSRQENNLNLLQQFFGQFKSLPFDERAAEVYGRIRAQLAAAGTLIGPYDLQIAAIALINNLTLVTHNIREFKRVTGLQIEDWEI